MTASLAHAVDPFLDWHTLSSENFHVHYADGQGTTAARALRIAETAHDRLAQALAWQPQDRTHLVISDETDFANGYATVININRSVLFMAPPVGVGGLEDFDDWLNLLITHEYVHVLHLDKVDGGARRWRNLFGRQLLGFPNVFEPAWIIEGLATWYETDRKRGIGRGQSSFYESMMRAEVMSGIKPVEQVNLPITSWPAGATRYLYGVYFFNFLEERYGEESIQKLVHEYSHNLIPFSINTTFERAYGKDVSEMWGEFSDWLRARYQPAIESIERAGVVQGERFSDSAYRTRHVRAAGDAVYYIRNNGDHEESLVKHSGDDMKVLAETTNASFDLRDNGDLIISQLEVCDEYAIYYDLYLFSAAQQQLERLTECGRYQRAVFSPDGVELYVLRHDAGSFELQVLDSEAKLLRRLHLFDEGDIPGWFDVSPDGDELVIALWRNDYGWNLYRMSLQDGKLAAITRDDLVQAYPEYSPDGRYIYYSMENGADAASVYDLYRIDTTTGKHQRISRSLTGALQSSFDGDALYYTAYGAEGTYISRMADVGALETHRPAAGERIEPYVFAELAYESSEYSPFPGLEPQWWFPILLLNEDQSEIGLLTAGNDALGIHNYFATASLDTALDTGAASFVYSFSNVFSFAIERDNELFRNSAGDKDRVRSEDRLRFVFQLPDSGAKSSSSLLLSIGWEHNFDNGLFNNATPAADFDENLFGLAWLYRNADIYPLSISANDGRNIRLVAEDGSTLDSDLDGQVYTAAWQEFIGLGGEHVLALRATLGYGDGITSRFQLGGEDTGIDYDIFLQRSGVGLFGRRDYALRGYPDGLPQLRGRRAQLYTAEYRFPGQRIERGIMAPPLAIMQWSGAVFAETGAAYDDSADSFYSSVGAELNAELNLFYMVPVTARFGIAEGLEDELGDTRAYLSLGASF